MFQALVVGVFFALWVWVIRRNKAADAYAQRLQIELAAKQRDLENAEHRVQQILGFLSALHEHKGTRARQVSWQDLADFVVRSVGPLLDMDTVVLLNRDPHLYEFKGVAGRGISPQHLTELQVRPGEGVLGRAAQDGKLLIVQEKSTDAIPEFLSVPYLGVPLWVQSQPQGLLLLCRPRSGSIGQDAVRMATLIAKHIELTLENVALHENNERVYTDLVIALTQAVCTKDAGSQVHTDHCRELVRAMALEMRLPALLVEQMEFGAMLHDVGKLGISDAILSKSGSLTPEEYALVKQHPGIGYQLLRNIDFLKAVAPIVLYHHEWINGQGYPEGLVGEEIPLGARMVAIADAWDTMTTDQPYRKALPKNEAIAELRQQAGAQFDPKLVDIFLHVVEGKRAGGKAFSSSGGSR